MESTRDRLKNLITFNKVTSSLFNVEYNDDLVYAELDKISSQIGSLSKYSESVNNVLAEELLKRIVADMFIEEYGDRYTEDNRIVNIEHMSIRTSTKLFFTVGKIEGKKWGSGYIYSIRDGSI